LVVLEGTNHVGSLGIAGMMMVVVVVVAVVMMRIKRGSVWCGLDSRDSEEGLVIGACESLGSMEGGKCL
jgi:hypothetical protein